MEKNLNIAPTEQELLSAGFCKAGASNHSNYGKLIKRINDNLFVMFGGKKCSLCFDYGHVDTTIKEIEPTKAAINAEFKHFGQPLPQWERPKPKVGEVWGNEFYTFLIIKDKKNDVLRLGGNGIEGVNWDIYEAERYGHNQLQKFTKLADTLEDYYKEKFLKEIETVCIKDELDEQSRITDFKLITMDMLTEDEPQPKTVIDTIEEMNKEIFKPTTIDPKSQLETAHQYSYKGLKAAGKIPHDRSGEDYDSIEAFKKLLAICEALNGMFEKDESDDVYCPAINFKLDIEFDIGNYQDESPIYFTSKEAFEAFKSAPENVELFKTFLKIK